MGWLWGNVTVFGLVFLCLTSRVISAAEAKRVLLVHSFVNVAPPFTVLSKAFETELRTNFDEPLDLDEVWLNVARYASLDMEEAVVDLLRKRQARWQPDVVVPISAVAARFVATHRERLFPPTTPIIYTGLDQRTLPPDALAHNAAFVGTSFDVRWLVEDILQLRPSTTNIAVVIGTSPLEQYWKDVLRHEYQQFTNRISFTWLDSLSFGQILERAKVMPPHSSILLILLMRDANGVPQNTDETLRSLHAVANAPIHGLFSHQLGLGIVGGRLSESDRQGIEAARITAQVLRGEPATNFGPVVMRVSAPQFDWRELERWKIGEANLPEGSKVLYRVPTTWERHKWRIVAIVSVVFGQGALIALLVLNLARRKRVEKELRESQTSMTLAADAARLGISVWETSNPKMWTSDKWREIHGYDADEEVAFQDFLNKVHPQDREIVESAISEAVKRKDMFFVQHRVTLPDGGIRWISKNGRAEPVGNNGASRVVAVAIDITEQVMAETAAREVSGRLINAQEEERKRIARDLHDDLNQRLAMLSVEADLLGQIDHAPGAQPLIEAIAIQVKSLSTEIHKLSYQLHPAKLEQLGLVSATRALCNEQSKLWAVPIDFVQIDIPRDLNRTTALSIYRIVQEGLQNVGRHSQATHARVELTRQNEAVRLVISDDGRGFNTDSVTKHAGLGLLGMRERVHLAHGQIEIQSSPGKGTIIEVRVPISEEPPTF